jgi:predicted DNA-binding WGR domain protein
MDESAQMPLFDLPPCVRPDRVVIPQQSRDHHAEACAALIARAEAAKNGQAELFSEQVALRRIRPEKNEFRYYRLQVWPDLFGRALLVRHFGRIGTAGRRKLEPFADAGAAVNMLGKLLRAKLRRGYGSW